jgi:uncharacterized protein (DUF488 family)
MPSHAARIGTVYTVGHSNRTLDELLAILRSFAIETLVDIRRYPRSRSNPQFDGERLVAPLAAAGIEYVCLPTLGGRRSRKDAPGAPPQQGWRVEAFRAYAAYATTRAFRAAFQELTTIARRSRSAIMCSEALWWRCHRRIVADYLLAEGLRVRHILGARAAEDASLTPFAQLESDGTLLYPTP